MDKTPLQPQHARAPRGAILEAEHVEKIREALLIGLASYGEIERLDDQQRVLDSCKRLRVIHPTGAPDTIGLFATALLFLEYATVAETGGAT